MCNISIAQNWIENLFGLEWCYYHQVEQREAIIWFNQTNERVKKKVATCHGRKTKTRRSIISFDGKD